MINSFLENISQLNMTTITAATSFKKNLILVILCLKAHFKFSFLNYIPIFHFFNRYTFFPKKHTRIII